MSSRAPKQPPKLLTNHHRPWALVRRAGDQEGKRQSVRMAYLVDTVAPDGKAVAFTGYIAPAHMRTWTKSKRRIEFFEIIGQWRYQPSTAEIAKIKRKLPIATVENIREFCRTRDAARLQGSATAARVDEDTRSEHLANGLLRDSAVRFDPHAAPCR